ncbi:MAG: nucleotidyltransferase domain-containing protein [Chloroflexi bacterium]|nr:nucleotidyltransferase domain-containing protein [Chloroflexota bacterium]
MFPHHQQTIARLTDFFQTDPAFLALIIGGSIVKGFARPDSDVDFMLVATPDEYARRVEHNAFQYVSQDFTDYEGGYVDGKVIDVAFLRDAADHGSEPARSAFDGAIVAYTRDPEVAELVARIPAYPEQSHTAKIKAFHAQVQAHQWFVSEAEKRGDAYLMTHAVGQLVLFGGRMILAHNRILYPYHKWFMTMLRRAPDKPENLMTLIDTLLAEPSKAHADAFCECVFSFTEWDIPTEGWPVRFMHDSEWTWRNSGGAPVMDW